MRGGGETLGEFTLSLPISGKDVRKLKVGDVVYLTGVLVTARDRAHHRILRFLSEGKKLPVRMEEGVIYHCGPLARKEGSGWKIVSAGPTTSERVDAFLPQIIRALRVRAVVGKGGVRRKTAEAMREMRCVYLAFPGGCGALAAQRVKGVKRIYWSDLGLPEALWVLEVEDFGPLFVGIDTKGKNRYEEVKREAVRRLRSR